MDEKIFFMGDTFNRPMSLCYATEAGEQELRVKEWEMSRSCDGMGEITLTCDYAPIAKSVSGINTHALASSRVDELSEQIKALEAKIDSLQQPKKEFSELRSALRTLNYRREVQ